MPEYKRLNLDAIDVDWSIQPRANGLDQSHVDELAEAYRADTAVEPPVVWKIALDSWEGDRHIYRLSQGFHRYQAMLRAGVKEAKFGVRLGTADECAIDAACSNRTHGLKRTNADKRRSVEILLKRLPKESDRAIAERAGVTHPFVSEIRSQVVTVTTSPPPPTRTGRDGKEYPSAPPPRPEPRERQAPSTAVPVYAPSGAPPPAAPPPDTIICPHCLGAGRIPKPPPVPTLYDASGMPPIPDALDTVEFIIAWESWLHERKKRKQPVTLKAAGLQLRDLEAHGPKIAIQAIEQSIKNGWTGLFPGKVNDDRKSGKRDGGGRGTVRVTGAPGDFDACAPSL